MSREDRQTNLEFYLKEKQTNLNDQTAVLDFIETEMEVNRNANNM